MTYVEIDLDILYFFACPLVLIAGLFILLRRRAHWTRGLGLSMLLAVGAGIAWVNQFKSPSIIGPIFFFFVVPLSAIFLASQIRIVQRHPWSLWILGPLFYVVGVFLAANVWTRMLVRPV